MQDQEVVREFLVESYENLSRLDRELVEIEGRPEDSVLLSSIFRTVHTIKGTCGFLAFSRLERIAHQAENLLSQLRSRKIELSPNLVSLILETVDAIRKVLASIESTGKEGDQDFGDLVERLQSAAQASVPVALMPAEEQGRQEPDPPPEAAHASVIADANIRVGVGLLDKLMDLVGELVLTRNQILQFNSEREDAPLNATSQRLNLITSELQDGVMKTRMQPVGVIWNSLPRVVRDIAFTLNKKIRFEMQGAETELDRTIIEAIKDPLVHLVRNACDHGIEAVEDRIRIGKPPEGVLSLRAWHEGGQVNIEIGDDGAGIDLGRVKQKAIEAGFLRPEVAEKLGDREALNLIFHAGLSTAENVTKLSGRGVGMDVVLSHVEKIGGVIDVFSVRGEGTRVRLKIPLTLAIIPGLVVTSGGERFVIPQASLRELVGLKTDSTEKRIEYVNGIPVYRRRGKLLPIAYLNQVLKLRSGTGGESLSMVVLQAEDQQFGLMVDGISDTQEIVVKPLGKQLKGLNVYAGATIMGDGHIALILDVHGIGRRSGVVVDSSEAAQADAGQMKHAAAEKQRLLLFRAGSFERLALPLSLVSRLEEFPRASIEFAAGRQVIQYRDQILPLIQLQHVLEPDASVGDSQIDPVPVIVFSDGGKSAGVMVDQIFDIAEDAITVRQPSVRPGLLGSAVIARQVTDFLDLGYVLQSIAGESDVAAVSANGAKQILLAEPSGFSRALVRGGLDLAGYRVIEAASSEEAIANMEQPFDAALIGFDLQPDGALLQALRQRCEEQGAPAFALVDAVHSQQRTDHGLPAFHRDAMVESLTRLSAALGEATAHPMAPVKEN